MPRLHIALLALLCASALAQTATAPQPQQTAPAAASPSPATTTAPASPDPAQTAPAPTPAAQAPAPPVTYTHDKAAGASLYKTAGCQQCHGAQLQGTDDGVSLQGIGKTATREELTHQIVHGGGGMPAFHDALSDEQIAHLVDFLESEKKLPKTPVKARKAAAKPAPAKAAAVPAGTAPVSQLPTKPAGSDSDQ